MVALTTMVGMSSSLSIYRRREGWRGLKLEGLSVQRRQFRRLRERRDKDIRRRVDQEQGREQEILIRIPASSLPESCKIEPGDLVLFDQDPEWLDSPSQPRIEGWDYAVVAEVEDRRLGNILPHLLLRCV